MVGNIKNVFIFDVDGTLLKPSGNAFDQESKAALTLASKYGDVILASARPLQGILSLYSENLLKINNIIALNGALILKANGDIVISPIPLEIVNYFFNNSKSFKNLWFFTKSDWYASNLDSKEYEIERNAISLNGISLESYRFEDVLKITIVSDTKTDSIIRQLSSIFDELEITTSNDFYVEMQSNKTNKFLASKNLFADTEARIFSFGDSNNDVELLKNSFFSCAVANATAQAKEVSKFVSIFQHGKGVLDSVNFVTRSFL